MARALAIVAAAALAAGCASAGRGGGPAATAAVRPFPGQQASAEAQFSELPGEQVRVEVTGRGLQPGDHGIHVHETGDCSAPAASGGHLDPSRTGRHGFPGDPVDRHHAGDLPNLVADASGAAHLVWETSNVTVSPGPRSVVGRALVIHARPDDYLTNPAGASGDRIACGVIAPVRPEQRRTGSGSRSGY